METCKLINGIFMHCDDCTCDNDYMLNREAQEHQETEAINSYFETQNDSFAYEE